MARNDAEGRVKMPQFALKANSFLKSVKLQEAKASKKSVVEVQLHECYCCGFWIEESERSTRVEHLLTLSKDL
jgi:hypothetical protein